MNTLKMKIVKDEPMEVREYIVNRTKGYQEYILFAILLLLWFLMPLADSGEHALVTDGLWDLVVLSALCFLGMLGLCWWLLKRSWVLMGLPELGSMVVRFKQMKSCYQIGFYGAFFALLLLAAVGCLIAVL